MRRSRSQSSSLDLLLDTLANALGSIMLIAILVALTAGPIPTTPTEEAPKAEEEQTPEEPEPLLANLPTTEASQQRIQELTAEIQSYKAAGVQPHETTTRLQEMYTIQRTAKNNYEEKLKRQVPTTLRLERPTYARNSWTPEEFKRYINLPSRDIVCSNGTFYFSGYVMIGQYPHSSGALTYTKTDLNYCIHYDLTYKKLSNYSYSDPQLLGRILSNQYRQQSFDQVFIRTDASSILQAQQLRNELARHIPSLFIADILVFDDNAFYLRCAPANIKP